MKTKLPTILLLHLALSALSYAGTITGTVTRVIDGDTVEIKHKAATEVLNIRLADIDAPELAQSYGPQARAALSHMVLDQTVIVEYSNKDFFGRIIGTIHLSTSPSSLSINSRLLAYGHCWHYRKYSKSKKLAQLQTLARNKQMGLWQSPAPIAPWEYRKR